MKIQLLIKDTDVVYNYPLHLPLPRKDDEIFYKGKGYFINRIVHEPENEFILIEV